MQVLQTIQDVLQSATDSTLARYKSLDEFTRAYIECALWSETDDNGNPLDKKYGLGDIAPETILKIVADCKQFQEQHFTDLARYNHANYSAAELGGHDYLLTRNGHGAGFWDRDCLPQDARDSLSRAARGAGEVYFYVGDDNLIYC